MEGTKMKNEFNPRANRLLAALPEPEFSRVLTSLELTEFQLGASIYEPGQSFTNAYFPISSIISLLDLLHDGGSAEISVVGNEGIVGIALFMGGESMPSRAVVQSGGLAYRISGTTLVKEFNRSGIFQNLLMRYTLSLLSQIALTVVCNRHHTLEQQFCRWLLLCHDRLTGNVLKMNELLISDMLGVNAEGAIKALGKLQHARLISYAKGWITILDRKGLEARVCECYDVIRQESNRLFPTIFDNEVHPSHDMSFTPAV